MMKDETVVKMFRSAMREAISKLLPVDGVKAADDARRVLAGALSTYEEDLSVQRSPSEESEAKS